MELIFKCDLKEKKLIFVDTLETFFLNSVEEDVEETSSPGKKAGK